MKTLNLFLLFGLLGLLRSATGLAAECTDALEFARLQTVHRVGFEQRARKKKTFTALPDGLLPALQSKYGSSVGLVVYEAFEKLRVFTQNHVEFFLALQRLETELFKKNGTVDDLRDILSANEAHFGFAEAVDIHEFVPDGDFSALVMAGHPINDHYFSGTSHGTLVHRLQLYIWSKYLETRFRGYSGERSITYLVYVSLADPAINSQLNWSKTGVEPAGLAYLWNAYMDAFDETHFFGSAEYLAYHWSSNMVLRIDL